MDVNTTPGGGYGAWEQVESLWMGECIQVGMGQEACKVTGVERAVRISESNQPPSHPNAPAYFVITNIPHSTSASSF